MESITEIFSVLGDFFAALKINPMYILLWVAAGYIQKQYLQNVSRISEAWKTLILGSLFSFGYALLLRPLGDKGTWVEFFASYIFATSMYELFIKDLVNKVLGYVQGFFNRKLEQ
jgi:hypothetical protein